MAGLTNAEMLTMEYFYDGEPLVYVAEATLTPANLESEFSGEPFMGIANAEVPVTRMTVVIIT